MSRAVRADPELWEAVRLRTLRAGRGGLAGVWNARKAMLAVNEYKRLGGRYVGPRDPRNSLKKWEAERWGYVAGDPDGRYLPEAVRRLLTPAEARRENALKRGRKGEWVSYSPGVAARLRAAGVFGRPAARRTSASRAAPARPADSRLRAGRREGAARFPGATAAAPPALAPRPKARRA